MHVAMGFIRSQLLIRLDYENIDDDDDEDGDESLGVNFETIGSVPYGKCSCVDTKSRFQHLEREAPSRRRMESINKFMFDFPVC